jgi:DNA polymerase III epsilon subunit-like protein
MKLVWVDIESPNLNPDSGIIELAALYEDTEIGDKSKAIFHKFCKPEVKPESWDKPLNNRDNKTITDLTGITWNKLESEGISENELYTQFSKFLAERIDKFNKQDKAIFVAYNAKFDADFIRALWKRNNDNYYGSWFLSANLDILSTVALAIRFDKLPILPNNQLNTVADYLNIEIKAHSAISDIIGARKVQIELEKRLGIGI